MLKFKKFFKHSYFKTFYSVLQNSKLFKYVTYNKNFIIITFTGIFAYRKLTDHYFSNNVIYAKEPKKLEDKIEQVFVTSHREQRFHSFASIEYNNNAYMTPRDFLESIIYDAPRSRLNRKHLHQQEVEKFVKKTPSRRKSSKKMFRDINEEGLISFTEYLFLLCVLTKPRSGFKIAFSMFDTDGDERVDRKEFLILEKLLAHSDRFAPPNTIGLYSGTTRMNIWDLLNSSVDMQSSLFGSMTGTSLLSSDRRVVAKKNIWQIIDEEERESKFGEDGEHVETTLLTHFFGSKGKDVLNFQDFSRFMENLQIEVLELEFAEFSHGLSTISETDFAKILLRYTQLTDEEKEGYMKRLNERVKQFQGIKFEDFKDFCQFLNSIDDFSLAMRIYTYADHPISEVDFNRAVKACTGQNLNSHVVHVVFQLFDVDGDGRLSYKEFISVMKERLHRGAKTIHSGAWDSFKHCVQQEIRNA